MSQAPSGLQKDELWKLLTETVHALPMYKHHKHFVEDVMLKEKPNISPQELSVQLNITPGEAVVLLDELRGERSGAATSGDSSQRPGRTLLDYGG
jgi:hypothetical protein